MAMRRPRIKPVANILLNSKRKPKLASDVKTGNVGESNVNDREEDRKIIDVIVAKKEEILSNAGNLIEVRTEFQYDTSANINEQNKSAADHKNEVKDNIHKDETNEEESIENSCKNVAQAEDSNKNTNELPSKIVHTERKEAALNDSDAFKCPPKVEFQRTISHISNSGIDDVFYSDIEENALQMDLEKSPSSCPMSPSKNIARPRIKPTPHFGQRRNSFVGSSPSPHTTANEDNHFSNSCVNNDFVQPTQTRRERHHSASNIGHSLHHHTPHKYLPAGITNSTIGRIRTESGCSVFSDTNTSLHKRKIEDHKQNARKDFESRFQHGVPEKSVIKMSDLIFYNPTTNPMEQKPKTNVKLEQKEASVNDVKPFTEKTEIGTDKLTDETEAVPVPQLKLNAKGELILDDKSLVIETTAEQEARKVLANSSLIYLDEYTGMNGFYRRRKRSRDWIAAETIKFYRCLQNVGTDFSLMVTLFPNRTRRDLKLKFKNEEKKNNHLINKALLYPKQFDIESLKQQMDEEEKLREEQVKNKKKKVKKEKKKINCQSKATRTLMNGVYQNEKNQQENRTNKMTNDTNKFDDVPQTEKGTKTHNDPIEIVENEEVTHNNSEKKIKAKKSKKTSRKLSEVEKLIKTDYDYEKFKRNRFFAMKRRRKKPGYKRTKKWEKTAFIKREIKIENKLGSNETEFQDTKQLEMEIDDLLDMDAVDSQYDNYAYTTSVSSEFPPNISQVEQFNTNTPTITLTTTFPDNIIENDEENEKYQHKTFVNLDDGSLSVYSNIKDDIVFITSPMSPQPSTSPSLTESDNNSFESTTEPVYVNHETCSSVTSERELNEADIQSILTELAEGTLVLVSSLDPDDPDKVLNEIYMVDKNTGDLCEEPLSIPDNIVQCILTVVS